MALERRLTQPTIQPPRVCQPRQENRRGRTRWGSLFGAVASLVALLSMFACSTARTADVTKEEPRTVVVPSAAVSTDAERGDASLNDAAITPVSRFTEDERKREFRWTEDHNDDPCSPLSEHPDSRPDCASAKYIERLLSVKREVELVGRTRCSDPGCGARPDLLLGYTYPNNAIFLLTPGGERFPDICPDTEGVTRISVGRLRVRGRFESRRAKFVDDNVLWPGDYGPCDEDPHPVFLVRAWCIERGKGKPMQFANGDKIPLKHICGTPQPF